MQNDCDPKVCNDIKVLNSVPAINYQVLCFLAPTGALGDVMLFVSVEYYSKEH